MESAKLIAGLARIARDVGIAEDLAQDALLAALERWPQTGVPDNPGAWLMATAKHRSIDQMRRRAMLDRKHELLGHELEQQQEAAVAGFVECHMPNHLNIIVYSPDWRGGRSRGLALGDAAVFEPPAP